MSRIISIEGNIGSGKSTMVTILKKYYEQNKNVVFLQEPVDVWESIKDKDGETIIEKFYGDNKKYAFSFQMMAYISRLSQLKQVIKDNPNKLIISERCVLTDLNVFAKMLYDKGDIEDIQFAIYKKWFYEFLDDIPEINYIYIKAEPEVCKERIIKRNRKGEDIPLSYLQKCDEYHNNWLTKSSNVLYTLNANKNISEFNYYEFILWIKNIREIINTILNKKYSFNEEYINVVCSGC